MKSTSSGLFLIVCLLGHYFAQAQSCLQKFDSVKIFQLDFPEKARYYANDLLNDLDSGRCVTAIGLAAMYNEVGLVLWEINEKKKGLEAMQRGLEEELRVKASDHRDLLDLYYNMTTFYQEMGDFVQAGEFIEKADRVIKRNYQNDLNRSVGFYFKKGQYHREKGEFRSSIEALQNALQSVGDQNDTLRTKIQIELGTAYKHSGEIQKSEQALLDAIELAENRFELLQLKAIDRLSELKFEQGDFSDSETYLLENLEKKEAKEEYKNDPMVMLETYNNLSLLYYRLNDLESAEKYINQGLAQSEKLLRMKPKLMNNLGLIYQKKGDYINAEKYYRECSKAFQELYGSINPDYASSLSNLASIYKDRGELTEALNLYTKVLDLDRTVYGTNHPTYATSVSNVALLYRQMGNIKLSTKLLEQARKIRGHTLGEYHPLYIKTSNDLGINYLVQKDTIAAMEVFDHALDAEIHHMHDIFPVLTDNQRKLYFNETRSNIERYCALAFQPKFIDSHYAVDAVNHFINTKGMLFYASEKMRRVIQASDDENIVEVYNTWREEKYTLAQAYLLTEEDRQRQNLDIPALEKLCADLEKELAQHFSVFTEEERAEYHTWQEISNVLPDSTAVIDIIQYRNFFAKIVDNQIDQGFEDEPHYVAFVIKNDSTIIPVTWDRAIDFNKGVALYRNALKFGIPNKITFKIFWEPIQPHIKDIKKIYLSPDGLYHKINPAVLFDHDRKKYVADEHNIINITSGKDLLYAEEKHFLREARIMGNPDFSTLQIDEKLGQLPGAEQEAKEITGILDVRKWKTESFYFEDATEDQMKEIENPGIIHIATHGFFKDDPDNVDPLHSSGLFLSRAPDSENDGILTAYEAMNLLLDETSMVVLAACETGLGTVQNGEGVFGLQRAFLVAGADNVLISLVKINDKAARRFMNLLYEQLREVEDPQEAFFNARHLYRQEDSNPYNWGAYVLVTKG